MTERAIRQAAFPTRVTLQVVAVPTSHEPDHDARLPLGWNTMLFVVLEEVYPIAPTAASASFAGDRQAAQWYAKNRAAEFDVADYHDEDGALAYFAVLIGRPRYSRRTARTC
jgi:hypothetical protein